MDDFNSRVAKRRRELKLTQAQLAKRAGIPQSTIGQIENGRNKSTTKLLKLAAALETTPEYLINGTPPGEGSAVYIPASTKTEQTVIFKHRDIYVSCGTGMINAEFPEILRTLEVPKSQIQSLFGNIDTNGLDIVGIKGDSMEPTLPQKSVAFLNTKINRFEGDGIYAFYYVDGVYMKRLQKIPGKFMAHSDNENYAPFEITPDNDEQFHIIGKFVGILPLKIKEL